VGNSSTSDPDQYYEKFFEVGQLPPGQHKLVVAYFGNSATLPLELNYFVQQDASSSSSGKSTDAIIGGAIGGFVFILLFLGALFFNRRRNNRRLQAPVANPFTVPPWGPTSSFLPQNYTSNGQSPPSQSISSKSLHRGQLSNPTSMSSSGGIRPSTPLRSQFSSPAFTSPTPTGSQTSLNSTRARVPQAATEPFVQRSFSPQRANANFV
jgi:hypothetical protein